MKTALLVLASTVLALLLCEAGLRIFIGTPGNVVEAKPGATATEKELDVRQATPYIEKMPAEPGTDRRWFIEDPPPLPNRAAPSPERLARFKDYERRGIFGPQADYVWNRRFVESAYCSTTNVFQNYPEKIQVFDPPEDHHHPRFRFPPNTTTASGLVTNQFGLRGPPITLGKPPKTIRIAFVGASTTVNSHYYPFSYPERVVHWLNRFAEANHYDVRFEVLNSGREGLDSQDLAAILQDEVLPLDPDVAVYYEGSNQFTGANGMAFPPVPPRQQVDPHDPIAVHKLPKALRTHIALASLLDRSLNGFVSDGEPRKPLYQLLWLHGVSEQHFEVNSPYLPLGLPIIVRDLDSIKKNMQSIGGELVLCSFEWLVWDGMPISPTHYANVYNQLNTVLWPLRYADIRRLADFQNRVYRRYAENRGIPFLDVAAALPQDLNLFNDAIHMTDTGERVKAWIVFQQLVPIIRKQIESGQLPRPAGGHRVPPPPSLAISEMRLSCSEPPTGALTRINGVLSLDAIQLIPGKGSLERGHPMKLITPPERWAYVVSIPVKMPANLAGRAFVLLHGRVVNGQVGAGVLDDRNNDFQFEKNVPASSAPVDIYIPVPSPDHAEQLIIRNTAEGGVRSQMLLDDVALVVAPTP